nr:hypothetical protein Iba_chr06aCG17410 [Ipomoea batatas]
MTETWRDELCITISLTLRDAKAGERNSGRFPSNTFTESKTWWLKPLLKTLGLPTSRGLAGRNPPPSNVKDALLVD